jgi:hypothetical protein
MIIRYQAMDNKTNNDVAWSIDMGTHTRPPNLHLQTTRRHSYHQRRKPIKLKKVARMQDNFTFDKMRRLNKIKYELRPNTPHNTSQYIIANHTREAISPMVTLFSEYMIDDENNYYLEELLIDEICITGGTMKKLVKCRNECSICLHEIYDNVIETQRKMIESLEQQIRYRRTI